MTPVMNDFCYVVVFSPAYDEGFHYTPIGVFMYKDDAEEFIRKYHTNPNDSFQIEEVGFDAGEPQ